VAEDREGRGQRIARREGADSHGVWPGGLTRTEHTSCENQATVASHRRSKEAAKRVSCMLLAGPGDNLRLSFPAADIHNLLEGVEHEPCP